MNDENGNLAALVQEKLDADQEFQDSLADLSDEEKDSALADKRAELMEAVFAETRTAAEKHREVAEAYKIRAEKAERASKGKEPKEGEDGGGEGAAPQSADADLSPTDLYALMHAQVPPEDVPEVKKAAKLLEVSVADALKDDMVKAMLARNAEHRASAQAANTGSKRRSATKPSDTEILEKAKKGELPEPGTPEAEALYRARRGITT